MISTTDARALYTKKVIAVYSERPKPTAFLRSLFKTVEAGTKELSIEVLRGTERIAVDVERGTEGNRNQFSRSAEKIFVPPYYSEYFDMTQLDLYDALFLRSEVDAAIFNAFLNSVVDKMMELCKKIRAVDTSDVARLIIERHFIRDTRGNLRKFSMQIFRCVGCNSKFRRPPLNGKCTKCGGRLIFTISQGSVLKYMQSALNLARDYDVSPYLLESLELTEMYIESIFGREKEKQEDLGKWF